VEGAADCIQPAPATLRGSSSELSGSISIVSVWVSPFAGSNSRIRPSCTNAMTPPPAAAASTP
jgi:hypothetical protein